MISKDEAKKKIQDLVKRFDQSDKSVNEETVNDTSK